jgi:hypothetical protein
MSEQVDARHARARTLARPCLRVLLAPSPPRPSPTTPRPCPTLARSTHILMVTKKGFGAPPANRPHPTASTMSEQVDARHARARTLARPCLSVLLAPSPPRPSPTTPRPCPTLARSTHRLTVTKKGFEEPRQQTDHTRQHQQCQNKSTHATHARALHARGPVVARSHTGASVVYALFRGWVPLTQPYSGLQ